VRLEEPGIAEGHEGSVRGVLRDAETGGELADRGVHDAAVLARVGVGDEGFQRSPREWAERAPRLIGHRAEHE
jgi:hypothetical protein